MGLVAVAAPSLKNPGDETMGAAGIDFQQRPK